MGQAAFSISSSLDVGKLATSLLHARHESVDQVDRLAAGRSPRLHGTARDEHGRHVDPHRSHEHPGHDLVAIRDADHAVEHVSLDHRLDTVGDQLARGERVFHAVVPHRDAVVHADRVEQEWHAARGAHAFLDEVAHGLKMDMPGNDIDVAVADRDERLVPVRLADPGGTQQTAVSGPGVASLDGVGTHAVNLDSDGYSVILPHSSRPHERLQGWAIGPGPACSYFQTKWPIRRPARKAMGSASKTRSDQARTVAGWRITSLTA